MGRADHGGHAPQTNLFQPVMSLILPVRGRQDDIQSLLGALTAACAEIAVEVIVVEDSGHGHDADDAHDDNVDWVHARFPTLETGAFSLRLLRSPWVNHTAGADDVAAALHAGVAVAQAPYVSLMLHDFPHPPEQLVRLYHVAHIHEADIAIGSRYRPGASDTGKANRTRALSSYALAQTARMLFPQHLSHISDPLSGLLLIRRSLLDRSNSNQAWPAGATLSLNVLLRAPWLKLIEVPYAFASRHDKGRHGAIPQFWMQLRQFARLFLSLPAVAETWKITCYWLLGAALAILPFAALQADGQPLWIAWIVAIETLLLVVACGVTLNADHRLRPLPVIKRWLLSHWRQLIPVGLHGALTLTLAPRLHSPLIAFGIASLASLAAIHLLDTSENPRRVLYTTAADSLLETVQMGRVDPGGRTLTTLMTQAALVAGLAGVAAKQLGPLVVVPTVIVGVAFILQFRVARAQTMTVVLAVATVIAAVDYTFWRIPVTNLSTWYIAIPLLLAELFGIAHMLGLQWSLWPRKRPRVRQEEDPTRRPIYILIPTVDEGREILEATARACIAARDYYLARYPHGAVTIVICNDGLVARAANWREPALLARQLGIACVTRWRAGGAKAGNVEYARQRIGATGDALIVLFDADQIARNDFLVEIAAPFNDSTIGWVQSGQYYRNIENPVARWADDQQALFYHLLCPGKESLNAAFMCGTNLMIRAAALDEIGGFPQDSVTEDFAASILLHARWRSVYLPEALAVGLGPLDLASYFRQQQRWAIGTFSVLRTHWRRIVLPGRGGLSLQQRLQYALGCTHYFCGIRDLIYVVAPLAYVYFGVPAVKNSSLAVYLWHFLPYWLLSMSAFAYAAWNRTGWRGVVIGFASFPILTTAALSVLTRRRARFNVTSKRGRAGWGRHQLAFLPHFLAWIASVVALIQNWRVGTFVRGPGFFVEMWLAYIVVMLTLSLWLATHDVFARTAWWQVVYGILNRRSRNTISARGWRLALVMANLAILGALVSALITTPLGSLLQGYALAPFTSQQAPAIPASAALTSAPYLGIDGPTGAVTHDAPILQSQLNARFSLIGRTQNVTDHFDQAWVDNLSAERAYPWLTIQFGRFQADGKPSLDASLMSIANGVHDSDLIRLAHEIRAYGKPVFITILPGVDRDWSLSSAVANGGIPADVPRAWEHVRSIFWAAGAENVAWVWAPHDAAHDAPFAPAPEQIDLVLVSVTYDAAGISDDAAVINDALANHPGKPALVEVTTIQRDQGERRWLQQIAHAVASTHAVAGLIYYDGRPEQAAQPLPSAPDIQALQAMWRMVAGLPGSVPLAVAPPPAGVANDFMPVLSSTTKLAAFPQAGFLLMRRRLVLRSLDES